MAAAERAIRRAGAIAFVAFAAAGTAAVLVLPSLFAFPDALAHRLVFAVQAAALVLVWVLLGVAYVSTTRRFSRGDIGGAASGPPSERLAIPAAFLQNTLEQAVLAPWLLLALAVVLPVAGPPLIVVAVVFFWIGRLLFLRGYPHRGRNGKEVRYLASSSGSAFRVQRPCPAAAEEVVEAALERQRAADEAELARLRARRAGAVQGSMLRLLMRNRRGDRGA